MTRPSPPSGDSSHPPAQGPPRARPHPTTAQLRDLTARPVVILAEDDDELRRLIAAKLRRRGCDVLEARTGMDLARLVLDRGVDPVHGDLAAAELIVSDICMPGMTGLEIIALLRQIDWALPVLLITGFGDAQAHAEARRLSARLFDKPVDLDALADAASRALGLATA